MAPDSASNSDLLIVAARHDEDVSSLEVWLYEEADAAGAPNIYVHHEVMLSAFPLSLAWMDCNPAGGEEPGNFVAVGTFSPEIEIWNMDIIDAVEPLATLGGVDAPAAAEMGEAAEGLSAEERKKLKKKIRKKKAKAKAGSSVPCLDVHWLPPPPVHPQHLVPSRRPIPTPAWV